MGKKHSNIREKTTGISRKKSPEYQYISSDESCMRDCEAARKILEHFTSGNAGE
jgi:hypothetical protein